MKSLLKFQTPKIIIILASLLVIFFIIFSSEIKFTFIFLALTIITGILVFFNYKLKIPLDFTPVFFLSLLLAYSHGFVLAITFILLGAIVPSILSKEIGVNYFFMVVIFLFLVSYSPKVLISLGVIEGGIVLSIVFGFIDMMLDIVFGKHLSKKFVSFVGFVIVNAFYFIKLSEAILKLLTL
ncbi:MAG: hypothetical protein J7K98_03405 [Candidatus Aenigmarchaeota archaeon]|nr:hypothetical protein [Candidatus Aenigmarchaeota archaeon]